MRIPPTLQATVALEPVKIQDDRLVLQAQISLDLPLPAQDADLPKLLETSMERGGQMLKRRLFQQAIEGADAAPVLARRHGKQGQGITCRGTTPFTFKTVFGTVKVRRRRIEHHADGTTEAPSAHAWQTPQQVALTAGLHQAACDGLPRDSARQTVARIDSRAGFTGHKDPIIHLKMLSKPYEWASVQMPLNVMDVHYRSFQKQVLSVLLQRGIGGLAKKSLGGNGSIVTKAGVPVEDALRYVLSLPISTLVSGIDSEKVLDQNLKIVRKLKPMTTAERAALEGKTLAMAGDGRCELFKSSKVFDGPVHRKQHGFDTAQET